MKPDVLECLNCGGEGLVETCEVHDGPEYGDEACYRAGRRTIRTAKNCPACHGDGWALCGDCDKPLTAKERDSSPCMPPLCEACGEKPAARAEVAR